MNDPILEVAGLSVGYRVRTGVFERRAADRSALTDVSFHVERGETLAVLGASGAGKSTLARALLRLIEPARGAILFRAERDDSPVDLVQLDARALRAIRPDIQIVFQDPLASMNPRLVVIDVLREALGVRAELPSASVRADSVDVRAFELLTRVGLSATHANRFPHELSGGERQRVCIARALAPNPKILVMDEAVASLDVSIRAVVMNLLVELKRELALSYVFIAHDLALARWFADRALVLDRGRVVEVGSVDDVCTRPQHAATRELVAASLIEQ